MISIPQFFENKSTQFANNPLIWEKTDGQYNSISYQQIQQKVHHLSAGLIHFGIKKGDRIALLSEGNTQWIISELALLYAGAICVPLSIKLDEPAELLFRILHSECSAVMVSQQQYNKVSVLLPKLPCVKHIIITNSITHSQSHSICLTQLIEEGKIHLKNNPNILHQRWTSVLPDDPANISYTSGTTADPKGIILTHKNYMANVEQSYSLMDIPPSYRTLLILPLDHAFAHTVGIYSFIGKGASLAMVQTGNTAMESLRNIPKNINEIKPDLLLSVPALARNFKKNIEREIANRGTFINKLFLHALKISYQYNKEGHNKGEGVTKLFTPLLWFYDKIIFRKIRQSMGGRLKFFIGGGALLDIELQRFFYAIGIPMFQGYGLSEAAPIISSNAPARHKLGSSGFLVKPLELKICDAQGNELPVGEKGEIVVKGANVMAGYWKNQQATFETIRNGWLYTGDMGYMDEDNFLYVLGRFKSLLISSDGEKYSPEGIEEKLVEVSPLMEQIMLHNNQNPYTIGLVYPNRDGLLHYLKSKGIDNTQNLAVDQAITIMANEINHFRTGGKFSGHFPERWLPTTFAIIPEGFTEQNKMLNSTLKMVRGKITERYHPYIEQLYQPEGKQLLNELNRKNMTLILKGTSSRAS